MPHVEADPHRVPEHGPGDRRLQHEPGAPVAEDRRVENGRAERRGHGAGHGAGHDGDTAAGPLPARGVCHVPAAPEM